MRKQTVVCKFQVTLKVPAGATILQAQNYIRDAIKTQCGALEFGVNPMFDLDPAEVTVSLIAKEVKYGQRPEST